MALHSVFTDLNRFHVCVFICWLSCYVFICQQMFAIFSNFVPRWRCTFLSTSSNSSTSKFHFTKNVAFSRDCAIYDACPPGHRLFEQPIPFHSAALDFGWICGTSAAYNQALYTQSQLGGVLFGTLIFGAFTDAFGRRPVTIFMLLFGILSILISATSLSWHFLLITRFLAGIFIGGVNVSMFILANELILPNQRMLLSAIVNWGSGRLGLTLLCLFFPDWRSASVAAAIAALPALFLIIFVLPESPIWLDNKNRMEKLVASQKKISSISGIPLIPVQKIAQQKKGPSFFELLREKALLKRLFVLWTLWFTAATSSYSIDLNSSSISGNLFINQCLLSSLIIISKQFMLFSDSYFPTFSRRNLHQWSQSGVILCFSFLSILLIFDYQGVLILVINLIGSIFNDFTWDACYLCAAESVPTKLRSSTVASCSIFAKTGALFAPLLVFLNSFWAPSAYLGIVLLGSSNLLNSYFGLVETKGVDLDAVMVNEKKNPDPDPDPEFGNEIGSTELKNKIKIDQEITENAQRHVQHG